MTNTFIYLKHIVEAVRFSLWLVNKASDSFYIEMDYISYASRNT